MSERPPPEFKEWPKKPGPMIVPEKVRAELRDIRDENFWNEGALKNKIERDSNFPLELWVGFSEIILQKFIPLTFDYGKLGHDKLKEKLGFYGKIFLDDSNPPEKRIKAIMDLRLYLRRNSFTFEDDLRLRRLITAAYVAEAYAMQKQGVDINELVPFSRPGESFFLKKKYPEMAEILERTKEKAERMEKTAAVSLQKAIEEEPSLKAKLGLLESESLNREAKTEDVRRKMRIERRTDELFRQSREREQVNKKIAEEKWEEYQKNKKRKK